MVKKVVIEAVLVPESSNERPEEIEKQILREIRCGNLIIPWCARVEKVRVADEK
jgi:hypothetical protein